jgi:hypothetical protein
VTPPESILHARGSQVEIAMFPSLRRLPLALLPLLLLLDTTIGPAALSEEAEPGWKAGTAKVAITPEEPIWMAGYAARTHPSEGSRHDLWVKALVLEDPVGTRAALVTLDVCGIDRGLSLQIRDDLAARFGLDRARLVLACSHTHCGPVVGANLITMYPLDDAQLARVKAYAATLHDRVRTCVERAVANLGPVELAVDVGRCGFAVNRRNNDQGKVPALRASIGLVGPDDHDVPVLRVRNPDGSLRGIVFGYACHCTTMDDYQLSGDYAGYAQIGVETAHPGATALFWAGCGGDQNPLPRGTIELAQRYGRDLAAAVGEVVDRPMRPVAGPLSARYEEIALEFAPFPDHEGWAELAKSENRYEAARARAILERWDRAGPLPTTYPYPVQVWKLGEQLTWVFLGGEVVVDYAHRLKRNLGSGRTWVSAYCNDVMAYIPSLRVLKEGGYEGGGAMVYYGQAGPWSERVEEQVIDAVKRLAEPPDENQPLPDQ